MLSQRCKSFLISKQGAGFVVGKGLSITVETSRGRSLLDIIGLLFYGRMSLT